MRRKEEENDQDHEYQCEVRNKNARSEEQVAA